MLSTLGDLQNQAIAVRAEILGIQQQTPASDPVQRYVNKKKASLQKIRDQQAALKGDGKTNNFK